jgi:hypothetical protein
LAEGASAFTIGGRLIVLEKVSVMRRLFIGLCCLLWVAGVTAAQSETQLSIDSAEVITKTDIYGQEVMYLQGILSNQTEEAYTNITLTGEIIAGEDSTNIDDPLIGEGIGYLVNACGAGLLPDFTLQPSEKQTYSIPLELYEPDTEIGHFGVTATGTAIEAAPEVPPPSMTGVTHVIDGEVVAIEWIDETNMRFGTGCRRDIFDKWTWYEYNLNDDEPEAVTHPNAEKITPALRTQLGLTDDLYFNHSMLSFPPDARRMVYQNELNTFYSAEPDGSFKRLMLEDMSRRTLQTITWLKEGVFLASYYGAHGDPVYYFTADVEGRILSERPDNNPPSLITPGATPDGDRVIIAQADDDGKTGYYLKRAAYPGTELLFESDVPGNNWPGPLVEEDGDGATFIFFALPQDDAAHLACFNLESRELHKLTPLPLNLSTDERAEWVLSPENNTIALAADGVNGGLWTIDLGELDACE